MADTERSVEDVKAEVLRCAKEMLRTGLVEGTAGNLSARLPDGNVVMTPSSLDYEQMQHLLNQEHENLQSSLGWLMSHPGDDDVDFAVLLRNAARRASAAAAFRLSVDVVSRQAIDLSLPAESEPLINWLAENHRPERISEGS